jgi:hypothetical protein
LNIFREIKLAFKLNSILGQFKAAYKENIPVKTTLKALWHIIAVSAPSIAGAAVPLLTGSHNPWLVATGTLIGTILPYLTKSPVVNDPTKSPAPGPTAN